MIIINSSFSFSNIFEDTFILLKLIPKYSSSNPSYIKFEQKGVIISTFLSRIIQPKVSILLLVLLSKDKAFSSFVIS